MKKGYWTKQDMPLLDTISHIREAAGVGHKPCLTELPGVILEIREERDRLLDFARKVASCTPNAPGDVVMMGDKYDACS